MTRIEKKLKHNSQVKFNRSIRYIAIKAKIKVALNDAIKANNLSRAATLINRANTVCRNQRNRNLAAGMPGNPWIDLTLDDYIAGIKSKGLI
jgi:hypothetical protein